MKRKNHPSTYGAFVLNPNAYYKTGNIKALSLLIDTDNLYHSKLLLKAANKIEVTTTWDLFPDADQEAYGEFAKKAIGEILKAPGLVKFSANCNMLGSPQVRTTSVF